MEGVDVVVHLAARAHRTRARMEESLQQDLSNRILTQRLVDSAIRAGVKRFVFMSTVAVYGSLESATPINESEPPLPDTPYGISKHNAELYVQSRVGLEWVVLRAPLVFGPGAPGNLGTLLVRISRGKALPIGLSRNSRSWVSAVDVAEFISLAATHPSAAGQVFHVTGHPPVSSLVAARALGRGLGRVPRLINVPPTALRAALLLSGRRAIVDKLFGDLVLDGSKATEMLGWTAKVPVVEGLEEVGRAWRASPWKV